MKKVTAFLSISLAIFFYRMIFLGYGYYYGDYKIQHYPWAVTLNHALKHFSLPLWVSGIGCGFPLLAEGQVGALDPMNIVLHFLMPPAIAYAAVFLLAFFLSGTFIYFLAKKLRFSESAGIISAGTFLFGSAYAGMVYGPASMRCFIWLPAGLYCVQQWIEGGPKAGLGLAGLALSVGFSFLAGYPQAAAYHIFAYFAFFGLSLMAEKRSLFSKGWLGLGAAVLMGIGIGGAQIFPTLELMRFSNRVDQGADFALSKSFNPVGLTALFWPGFGQFTAHDFYIGVLPLIFVGTAVLKWKHDARVKIWSFFTLVFVLAGFGSFNPVYAAAIRLFRFYLFRFPCKFMLYALFGFSMLAGIGWDHFWRSIKNADRRNIAGLVQGLTAAAILIYAAAHVAARTLRAPIVSLVESYVTNRVFRKPGHFGSLEEYFVKINAYFELVLKKTAWTDVHFLMALMFWGLAIAVICIAFLSRQKKILPLVFLIVMLTDWYSHAPYGTGLWGNCIPKSAVAADDITKVLSEEKGLFRTYEYAPDPLRSPRWQASSNLLFGYSSIGLYSPLSISAYKDYTQGLGAVDDSTGLEPVPASSLLNKQDRLRWMNVRYILSSSALVGVKGLHLAARSEGDYLYELESSRPRAFLTADIKQGDHGISAEESRLLIEDQESVRVSRYQDREVQLTVNARAASALWLSDLYYPGWKVDVNGRRETIYRANGIFRAVKLEKGISELHFRYEPSSFYWGLTVTGLCLLWTVLFCWKGAGVCPER